jgi:surface antigen
MRTTQPLLRSGLTVAAVAALPLTLTAGQAAAASGISVSTSGSTVSVTTTACSRTATTGGWGTASLLTSSQSSFAQGRQVALSGTTSLQSAAWSSVSPGTYTVIVMCAYNNSTAGTQSIIVSGSATPTISATASPSPSRGVLGGLGGATKDYGTLTLAVGGGLVAVGAVATGWFLRRRSRPYRL